MNPRWLARAVDPWCVAVPILLCAALGVAAPDNGKTAAEPAAPVARNGASPSAAAPLQPATPGAADIQARAKALEVSTELEEDARATALDLYTDAIKELVRADEAAARTAEWARLVAEAPALLAAIRAELAQPAVEPQVQAPDGATLPQLEQLLAQATAGLEAARSRANELQAEADLRANRATRITDQLAAARQRLGELETELAADSGVDETEPTRARRTLLQARHAAQQHEIAMGEQEAASYDARRELLSARRDQALRRVSDATKRHAAWQELLNQRRQQEAAQAAREAERRRLEAARQHPALQQLAATNAELAAARTGADGVTSRIIRTEAGIQTVRQKHDHILGQFRSARRRMAVTGMTNAAGLLMRRHYESLPLASALKREANAVRRNLGDAQYKSVLLEEQRSSAGAIDARVREVLEKVDADDRSVVGEAARELAIAQRDLIDQSVGDYRTYVDRLIDLDTATAELVSTVRQYRDFIGERILWVPSVTGPRTPALRDIASGFAWLIEPGAWRSALTITGRSALGQAPLWGLALIGLLSLLAIRRRAVGELRQLASLTQRPLRDSMALTLRAILPTLVLALPVPAFIGLIGWMLASPDEQTVMARAVGEALQSAALLLLPLTLLGQFLRPDGLALAHLQWRERAARVLARHLRWFVPTVAPLMFLANAMDRQKESELWGESLGRTAFMAAMLALAVFLYCVLRPHGPVLGDSLRAHPERWLYRARHAWFAALLLVPLTLIATAWLGYYYTALQFEQRLEHSFWILMLVLLAHALLLRWLFLGRRNLVLDQARRKRDQAAAGSPDATAAPTEPTPEVREIDIPKLDSQARRVIDAAMVVTVIIGLWSVWAQASPALRLLDRVQVWPRVTVLPAHEVAAGPDHGANGADALEPSPGTANGAGAAPALDPARSFPGASADDAATTVPSNTQGRLVVTLSDIGVALLAVFITIVAVRNVPGVVEFILLQRLPLDSGSRYAMSTIIRYAILIVGVSAACGAVGISWSTVQWLAAALMFGLAFGLQEIFANFISGLIILVERPIRIGDAVTVGQISGKVFRIQMRATTILDWDCKELIVPNKAFITDQVINWTLSDPMLRVIVPVGVSYEADVDQTTALLLRVAADEALVLEDPGPQALFLAFGDSSLNFELRVFIARIDHLMPVRNQLHHAIVKAFRAAGVEIAFPQRDLHIRSAPGLADIVKRGDELTAEGP